MNDHITVTGFVASIPRHTVSRQGDDIVSFRLASVQHASTPERLNDPIDGETNWYAVLATGPLAANTAKSVSQSDRLIVTGRLRATDRIGLRSPFTVEITADAIGHDLNFTKGERPNLPAETSPRPTRGATKEN